ncbi:MAG: class I SAM-dependent methyltransferase [Acidimicrobiales bacterium]
MKDVRFAHSAFTTAALYERGRSGYPAEAVDFLVEALGVGTSSVVVDLAAGTGKFTRELVDRLGAGENVPSLQPGLPGAGDHRGGLVVAVEPVADMRAELARVVLGARVTAGAAEALPLAPASVDAITVAQAFHWFDASRALAEFHRVLRPGGRVGLIWNRADTSVDWVARVDALRSPRRPLEVAGFQVPAEVADGLRRARRWVDARAGGRAGRSGTRAPAKRTEPWWVARCRSGFAGSPLFAPLSTRVFRHTERCDADRLVDWVASFSRFSKLAPAEQSVVVGSVRELAEREMPAEFDFPFRTDVFWTEAR